MLAVLQVLLVHPDAEKVSPEVPDGVLDIFEFQCREFGLVDEVGNFDDPAKLVSFFCNPKRKSRKLKNAKKN